MKLSLLLPGLIAQGTLLLGGCGQKSALFLPEPAPQEVVEDTENGPKDSEDDER
ncbi:MAG: lipoprotein [Gammaproteobacteria bacterium]